MSNKPDSIDYAVRRSLEGEAGRVAMHLEPKASIPEILYKLDSIYGDVEKKVDLLGDFFNARQREDENVTSWSCRLEDMIGKAVTRGLIDKEGVNEMLQSVLFRELRTSLKALSGHKFDRTLIHLELHYGKERKTMSYDIHSTRHTQLKQQ